MPCQFFQWKHYPDFVSNMVYFLAGLTPPSDLQLLYTARQRFREIDIQRQLTSGIIEFAAAFSADTSRVDAKLAESEEILGIARSYFVDLDLQSSVEETDRVLATLREAYDLALKAKRMALFWTYVTEWLVVTATGLICGVGVWTLMIRRRLYREVYATRARHLQREF
jgi:methylase of polypeptide subunit release factors